MWMPCDSNGPLKTSKRMTPSNFEWFLHAMLFYHDKHVLETKKQRNNNADDADNSDEENQDDGQEEDV